MASGSSVCAPLDMVCTPLELDSCGSEPRSSFHLEFVVASSSSDDDDRSPAGSLNGGKITSFSAPCSGFPCGTDIGSAETAPVLALALSARITARYWRRSSFEAGSEPLHFLCARQYAVHSVGVMLGSQRWGLSLYPAVWILFGGSSCQPCLAGSNGLNAVSARHWLLACDDGVTDASCTVLAGVTPTIDGGIHPSSLLEMSELPPTYGLCPRQLPPGVGGVSDLPGVGGVSEPCGVGGVSEPARMVLAWYTL